MEKDRYSVGVIVARMQGHKLHPGWRFLIEFAQSRESQVLVVLGDAPFPTPKNPLSFEMRKAMIREAYPHVMVFPLADTRTNADWSASLDALIEKVFALRQVTLYGSRRSFSDSYSGRYPVENIPQFGKYNGTDYRKRIAKKTRNTADFRRGVIYAYETRLAVTRPMVDIAIIKHESGEILLGGKSTDAPDKWRLIGGLVDATDESLEAAAKREATEETSFIELDNFRYVGSQAVGDWRYHGTGEFGITTLFRAQYIFGAPRPGDDIERLQWFPLAQLDDVLVEEHKSLGKMLLDSIEKETLIQPQQQAA